jgi:3-methyl-2-oxobutanoate hydroxymethyltransferase
MAHPAKVTTASLRRAKEAGQKITALTCYDHLFASLLDEAGVDVLLVGDSLAMTVQGQDTTLPVTMDQMVYHTQLVARRPRRGLVVADMPFLSYQVSVEQALANAGRLLQEGGAEAIKLEGGTPVAETVGRLVQAGIPVMGHLGLTPQSIHQFGGYQARGTTPAEAEAIVAGARQLEAAGAFAIVLEKIPSDLAARVTEAAGIPTIGIGAGPHCDGQVLVTHDMLGLFTRFRPRFVRRYAELADSIRDAFRRYAEDVRRGEFPGPDESY